MITFDRLYLSDGVGQAGNKIFAWYDGTSAACALKWTILNTGGLLHKLDNTSSDIDCLVPSVWGSIKTGIMVLANYTLLHYSFE